MSWQLKFAIVSGCYWWTQPLYPGSQWVEHEARWTQPLYPGSRWVGHEARWTQPRSLSGWGTTLDEPKLIMHKRQHKTYFLLPIPPLFLSLLKMSSLVILISVFLVGLPGCGDGLQRVCAFVAVHEAPPPPLVSGDDPVDLCKQQCSFNLIQKLDCAFQRLFSCQIVQHLSIFWQY